tara:strand:+ start:2816 stop:3310 length:495 start_codon:yes stop_codon:yes gene_type:complete
MLMKIRIITTGGTFEKVYDPLSGSLIFTDSFIPKIVTELNIDVSIIHEKLFSIDSTNMNEEHRRKILKSCQLSEEKKILIIHGTDTMTLSAKLIGKHELKKTILFTGSMTPFSINNSEASFNLGYALAKLDFLKKGVFIAMNGRLFDYKNVKKNKDKGVFEKLY